MEVTKGIFPLTIATSDMAEMTKSGIRRIITICARHTDFMRMVTQCSRRVVIQNILFSLR